MEAKCLLCFKDCSKQHNVENSSNSEEILEDDVVNRRLQLLFLLREVLEIPKNICSKLQKYGDPCQWINCCRRCSILIESSKETSVKLLLLQKEYEDLQYQIKHTIALSVVSQEDTGCKLSEAEELVRTFVSQAFENRPMPILNEVKVEDSEYSDSEHNADLNYMTDSPMEYVIEDSDEVCNLSGDSYSDVESYHSASDYEDENETGLDKSDVDYNTDSSSSKVVPSKMKNGLPNAKVTTVTVENNNVNHPSSSHSSPPQNDLMESLPYLTTDRDNGYQMNEVGIFGGRKSKYEALCRIGKSVQKRCKPPPKQDNVKKRSYKKRILHVTNWKERTLSAKTSKIHTCLYCGKDYEDIKQLNRHLRSHSDETPFRCHICGKGCKQSGHLSRHMVVHSRVKPFPCDSCDKAFSFRDSLKRHRKIHTGERPFGCETCGRAFALKETLKEHIRTHTGEKPYLCTLCPKRFSHSADLRVHLKVHRGEKPFTCLTCGKSFVLAHLLRSHEFTHTKIKRFLCGECGKRFCRSHELTRHKQIHTDQRPYECLICQRSFSQKRILKQHEKIHSRAIVRSRFIQ